MLAGPYLYRSRYSKYGDARQHIAKPKLSSFILQINGFQFDIKTTLLAYIITLMRVVYLSQNLK